MLAVVNFIACSLDNKIMKLYESDRERTSSWELNPRTIDNQTFISVYDDSKKIIRDKVNEITNS